MNKEKTMKFEDIKLKDLQDVLNEIMKNDVYFDDIKLEEINSKDK